FFFSSRRRHTRSKRDWSSDVCSSDLDRGERAGLLQTAVSQQRPRPRPQQTAEGHLTGVSLVSATRHAQSVTVRLFSLFFSLRPEAAREKRKEKTDGPRSGDGCGCWYALEPLYPAALIVLRE